jgi:hypothetical protein
MGAFVVVAGCLSWGQYTATDGSPRGTQLGRPPTSLGETPTGDPLSTEKRVRALNADRHKSMVSDTEKLVRLARQLDAEIASNPTSELTPEEVRKVVAIEKLAHNVKTKMAQSFGEGPDFKSPVAPIGVRGIP